MSWFCSVCEKSFSRKDNMQRQVMSKHCNAGLSKKRRELEKRWLKQTLT